MKFRIFILASFMTILFSACAGPAENVNIKAPPTVSGESGFGDLIGDLGGEIDEGEETVVDSGEKPKEETTEEADKPLFEMSDTVLTLKMDNSDEESPDEEDIPPLKIIETNPAKAIDPGAIKIPVECLSRKYDDRESVSLVVEYDGGYIVNANRKLGRNDGKDFKILKGPNYKNGDKVRFYEHVDFEGKYLDLGPGDYSKHKDIDGFVSSVQFILSEGDCADPIDQGDNLRYSDPIPIFVKYYRDANFKGSTYTALKSGELGMNDSTSSIVVFKGPDWDEDQDYEATFYQHNPASGSKESYGPGEYAHLEGFNDIFSSVVIAPSEISETQCRGDAEPHEYDDGRVAVPLVVKLFPINRREEVVIVNDNDSLDDSVSYITVMRGPNYRVGDKVKLCKDKKCLGDDDDDYVEVGPGRYGKDEIKRIDDRGFDLGGASEIQFIFDGAEGSCSSLDDDGLTWKEPIRFVVDAFQDADFEGVRIQFIGDTPNFGFLNDIFSSLKIHKGPHYRSYDKVIFYEHSKFNGRGKVFSIDEDEDEEKVYRLGDNNDSFSSVYMSFGDLIAPAIAAAVGIEK